MKKFFIVFISLLLTAVFLTGCTPASEIMVETTTKKPGITIDPITENTDTSFKDYVICSDSLAIYSGEYNYFFIKLCSSVLDNDEYGIDSDKSLKEQYVAGSQTTWFDVVKNMTLDYMKELLYVYELALKSDGGFVSSGERYIQDYFIPELDRVSDGDPSEYVSEQFNGIVSYQNYLNAVRVEYIYDIYVNDAAAKKCDKLTVEEIEEYADASGIEKDGTLTRKAVCVGINGGKTAAEEFKESFISGGELTGAALKAFADKNGNVWFEDVFTNNQDNYKKISEWLFRSADSFGALGAVEESDYGYFLVMYESNGEATYLHEARQALASKKVLEDIADGIRSYKFNISEEKLNAVNA